MWLLVCAARTGWAQQGPETSKNPEEKYSLDREQQGSPAATLKVSCFCLFNLVFLVRVQCSAEATATDTEATDAAEAFLDGCHPRVLLQSAQEGLTILDASSNINENSLECDGNEVRGTLRDSSAGLPGQLAVGSLIAASNLR